MGIRLSNVCWLANALGMGLSIVPVEWDYPMFAGKELANVPWEWD